MVLIEIKVIYAKIKLLGGFCMTQRSKIKKLKMGMTTYTEN